MAILNSCGARDAFERRVRLAVAAAVLEVSKRIRDEAVSRDEMLRGVGVHEGVDVTEAMAVASRLLELALDEVAIMRMAETQAAKR